MILSAAVAGGTLGALLRRRSGRTHTIGAIRKGDRPEIGVHAGFTNHISGG